MIFRQLHWMAIAAISTVACGAHSQPLAICVAAAKDQFELFSMSEKSLENRCECVQNRRNGQLPTSPVDWGTTGRNSPAMTLIECAHKDIADFYANVEFVGGMKFLEKKGLQSDLSEIERLRNFSKCVGEVSYTELLRTSKTNKTESARLDKNAYLKMYRACEIEARYR